MTDSIIIIGVVFFVCCVLLYRHIQSIKKADLEKARLEEITRQRLAQSIGRSQRTTSRERYSNDWNTPANPSTTYLAPSLYDDSPSTTSVTKPSTYDGGGGNYSGSGASGGWSSSSSSNDSCSSSSDSSSSSSSSTCSGGGD